MRSHSPRSRSSFSQFKRNKLQLAACEKKSLDHILVHYAEHGQLELETAECGQFNREPGPIELGNTMDFERFHCPKTQKVANSDWTRGHTSSVSTGLVFSSICWPERPADAGIRSWPKDAGTNTAKSAWTARMWPDKALRARQFIEAWILSSSCPGRAGDGNAALNEK